MPHVEYLTVMYSNIYQIYFIRQQGYKGWVFTFLLWLGSFTKEIMHMCIHRKINSNIFPKHWSLEDIAGEGEDSLVETGLKLQL